jgi:glutathione peroxidase-family protein
MKCDKCAVKECETRETLKKFDEPKLREIIHMNCNQFEKKDGDLEMEEIIEETLKNYNLNEEEFKFLKELSTKTYTLYQSGSPSKFYQSIELIISLPRRQKHIIATIHADLDYKGIYKRFF